MSKKQRKNEDSEYITAKKIRTQIFKYDLLPQEGCLIIFSEMDKILNDSISKIIDADMPYFDNYIKELILRVISGNTQSKNFFEKNDLEDVTKKKVKVLSNSELRFLKVAFNYLRPDLTPAQKKEIFTKSRFLRGVQEDTVSFFMRQAEKVKEGKTIHLNSLGNFDAEKVISLYQDILPHWTRYNEKKEEIIKPYLRLIYTFALQRASSVSQTLNNFQNGFMGLTKAIRQYTPTRFAVFPLVAKSWINQSILINVKSEVNFIKLPVGVWNTYHKLEKHRKTLKTQPEQVISDEELSTVSGIDLSKVKRTYESIQLTKVLSLDIPTAQEEEQGSSANWKTNSVEVYDDTEARIELESDFKVIEKLMEDFADETKIIFGLATGCINLIQEPNFNQEDLEKEIISQTLAAHNIEVIF